MNSDNWVRRPGQRPCQRPGQRPGPRPGKQSLSIKEFLEWAFQKERVRIDFNQAGRYGGRGLPTVGIEHVMMQQAHLGCRVDGGGSSDAHPDAEAVADALANLPIGCGGRDIALWLAELARAGRQPDWMPDAQPRLYPVDTHTGRHGTFAKTADAAQLGNIGWPPHPRRNRKGIVVYDKILYCPCVIRPTASQIAAARRGYLRWWGALRDLRDTFRVEGGLVRYEVTLAMPRVSPWKTQ